MQCKFHVCVHVWLRAELGTVKFSVPVHVPHMSFGTDARVKQAAEINQLTTQNRFLSPYTLSILLTGLQYLLFNKKG